MSEKVREKLSVGIPEIAAFGVTYMVGVGAAFTIEHTFGQPYNNASSKIDSLNADAQSLEYAASSLAKADNRNQGGIFTIQTLANNKRSEATAIVENRDHMFNPSSGDVQWTEFGVVVAFSFLAAVGVNKYRKHKRNLIDINKRNADIVQPAVHNAFFSS